MILMKKNSTSTSVRLPPELKAAAERYAADNGTTVSILAREALEARITNNNQAALLQGSLVLQDITKQIDYLYYLVDSDNGADDYQLNLQIHKEVKTLWKLLHQSIQSETRNSQAAGSES